VYLIILHLINIKKPTALAIDLIALRKLFKKIKRKSKEK